jgi:hypothetical protein
MFFSTLEFSILHILEKVLFGACFALEHVSELNKVLYIITYDLDKFHKL